MIESKEGIVKINGKRQDIRADLSCIFASKEMIKDEYKAAKEMVKVANKAAYEVVAEDSESKIKKETE